MQGRYIAFVATFRRKALKLKIHINYYYSKIIEIVCRSTITKLQKNERNKSKICKNGEQFSLLTPQTIFYIIIKRKKCQILSF